MNNRRTLLIALGEGTRAVPFVFKNPGGSAPKKDRVVCALTLLVIVWAALTMTTAISAEYPERPIRIIVPFPPGGGTDILTRMVANGLTEANGWHFVIDNRPGAGGNIGIELAAKAIHDGYTMVMGQTSNLAVNPNLYSKLPPIVARLSAATARVLSKPDMHERLVSAGEEVKIGPEAFAAVLRGELAKWGMVVKEAGIRVE